jgi:flagellar biosynthesis GTPase FlhF
MMNMQIKAAVARSGSDIDKISKTFGDFIQILTVGHLRKSGINVVSSTFDGGFIGMTGFVQGTLFEIEPAIIFDASTTVGPGGSNGQTGIKFHGLHKYLKYNANPERSRVTSLQKRPNRVVTPKSINNNVTQVINAKTNAAKANAAKANAAKANAAKANAAKANAAKANEKQNARNEEIRKAKRNEFIKKIKKFTNLDNRTKRGFILGFNNGENANNLLKQAERDNKNKKEGLAAIRKQTLRKR